MMQADAWLLNKQSKPKSYLGLFIVIIVWLLMLWLSFQLVQDLAS
jgi:hypothetical protein